MSTIARHIAARADDRRTALRSEDWAWTWAEWVDACSARAAWLGDQRWAGPPHVGLLLDNVADYSFWLGAAALAGAVIVGINPTRRGAELARDITHTDCQVIITNDAYEPLLAGLDLGVPVVDASSMALAPAALPDIEAITDSTGLLLLFTSGTTGAPKACWCSQGRLASVSERVASMFALTPDDVCYQAMPLFHSNALMAGWGPALVAGATTALRRRFSASGFLPDVRRFGATYFNYVGKPLSYILATPACPDDADNPLVRVFGNEAAEADVARFAARFGCSVTDGYGSTEGGLPISRVPGTPAGALGVGGPGAKVVDPETGVERLRARFDATGRLCNAEEAIGEMVNDDGAATFEGYYKNDGAVAARVRDGRYWTGDLGYRDDAGYFYFAGRTDDWLRVDGENLATAPIERILERHPDVVVVAVYAVPDPAVGDQAVAAIQLRPGATFDGAAFGAWIDAQPDLGPVWAPRFVRVVDALPVTPTNKILKSTLRAEGVDVADVWARGRRASAYEPWRCACSTSS